MCGIAGIIGRSDKENLLAMLQATRHRGPNDNGVFINDYLSIGMNRLSILDLSHAGHQPMISDDGRYVIVYNGEIYNFKEQRQKLINLGFGFKSNSDTEVVLNLYIKYKEECLNKMRGMFAFVIYDIQTNEVFGARDRMGIKPFLYTLESNRLVFCSEMKGILANSNTKRELDLGSVEQYLISGYITCPYTIIKNVKSLRPGHFFKFSNNTFSEKAYWDLNKSEISEISYVEACTEVKRLVVDSVKEELVSDVPVGIFLSGGLDSNVVTAAMKEADDKQIESFSVNFADNTSEIDETSDSINSAEYYKTNHHSFQISGKDVARDFDDYIVSLDQPSVDGINTYFVSKFSVKNVSVALSGLGGDEIFCGYSWQRYILKNFGKNAGFYNNLNPLYKYIRETLPAKYSDQIDFRFANSDFSDYYSFMNRIHIPEDVNLILKKEYQSGKYINQELFNRNKLYEFKESDGLLRNAIKADTKLFMASRLLRDGDSTSMLHSIEVRYPLIDHRLVEFVYSLPDNFKLQENSFKNINDDNFQLNFKENRVKQLLFDAFKNDLPIYFEKRAKKGFVFPYQKWMEVELKDRFQELLNDNTFIFDTQKLKEIKSINKWPLFILREWCKCNNIQI
jgi:asparagine synthase (glutamine-hydrolysing)